MAEESISVLVVDDDVALLGVMESCVAELPDCEIRVGSSAREALALLERGRFDIVVTDYSFREEQVDGLGILKAARAGNAGVLGIMITAYASLEISLKAIRLGAYDFLTKPFQIDELQLTVGNACERVRLARENEQLRGQVVELAQSLQAIRMDHEEQMLGLERLQERSGQVIAVGPTMRHAALGPVQSYLKAGQSISERLQRESARLEKYSGRQTGAIEPEASTG
jgi:DNA-binding NtrC family response regulator